RRRARPPAGPGRDRRVPVRFRRSHVDRAAATPRPRSARGADRAPPARPRTAPGHHPPDDAFRRRARLVPDHHPEEHPMTLGTTVPVGAGIPATEAELEPLAADLSAYVQGGRVRSSAQAISDAVDAERLGFRRVFLSERYDLKEAGALLGGMAALTSRLGIATSALLPGSRPPILTAALGATLHSAYGPRFVLGLGRG